MAFDLMKTCKNSHFRLNVKHSQVQECNRPSFDHPKILHILIDRANGYGCKKLAAAHGGTHATMSKFCRSMGFDVIKPHEVIDHSRHEQYEERAIRLMEAERVSDLKSIRKFDEDKHWAGQKTKEFCAWYVRNRYNTDIQYKILTQIQNHMNASLGAGNFRSMRLKKALGCTIPEFQSHLERNFLKGMTWENQGGDKDNWQIDHLKPRSWFDQTDPKQFAECWHYSNMQPAWRTHNYRKGNRFGEEKTKHGFQGTFNV